MDAKEKKFLKLNLCSILLVFVLYIIVQIVSGKIMGNEFKDYLFSWDFQYKYNALEPDQLRFEFEEDGIVKLGEVTKENGKILYQLYPVNKGDVFMAVYNKESGEQLLTTVFRVSGTGIITDRTTGNFTNYRMYHFNMVILCIVLCLILWAAFIYVQKTLRYSYQSVFYSGLAIWMTIITILQIRVYLMEDLMVNVYGVLQSAGLSFMVITLIPFLLFCIALSISNINLIRHEGFRSRNALGIILSLIMILGVACYFILFGLFKTGSELQYRVFLACIGIYSSIYAFMECFLLGSIICGTLAALHEPKYDKDYLIILGCKVRPDGSLYPLIRGRVDRAITFYKRQLDKTGKKAIFLPSGGQGTDETISEADAMKRYLLEQGIPEEQILVENQSKNTVQNMVFSKKLIEERTPNAKVAFSTTNFHVFRSGIISRQNNFDPDGMGSPTKWYFWPNAYMREVVGMMVYKWKAMVIVMIPIVLFLIAIQFVG